ncbi:RES domain-containing protein [Breznakibacter xylanolyticus]|uniref:RES domain-containing protein n=1 Tax=Breznakibacter xylanolyticus TaxID=990 RepID=A0A2W7NFL1_9BACT|nr:RES family NAD+ phosphorylase [Breznakibacter xylanolyticus]PZX10092.1 RES domain-containing protein [Breznakibacter xylanolyticus]
MRVIRDEREKYLNTTLKGIGSALTKGYRWNSLHTYLVYTAESRSLAMLEVSVHLDLSEDLPNDRYFVEIDIPDELIMLELRIEDLPKHWDSKPPILATQFIGDDFVNGKNSVVLKVPSSIVPQEYNYLINPNHPDAAKINVISITPFKFADRWQYTKSKT